MHIQSRWHFVVIQVPYEIIWTSFMWCLKSVLNVESVLLLIKFLGCVECMRYRLVTDVCSVCQFVCESVCLIQLISSALCKNDWTDQDAVWGEHSWEPMEHYVRHGSWSLHREGRGPLLNFGTPSYLWNGWSKRFEILYAFRGVRVLKRTMQK